MKKINFVNNSEPYLSSENLNQMQNNMEDATHRDITSGGNPVKCGYKVDGKDVYVKRINFGALPNNTNITKPTGIDLTTKSIIKIEGYCKHNSSSIGFPLPFAHPLNLSYSIMVNIDASGNLVVTTASDRSVYNGWFNIYYI
jgi:hypothetical protein